MAGAVRNQADRSARPDITTAPRAASILAIDKTLRLAQWALQSLTRRAGPAPGGWPGGSRDGETSENRKLGMSCPIELPCRPEENLVPANMRRRRFVLIAVVTISLPLVVAAIALNRAHGTPWSDILTVMGISAVSVSVGLLILRLGNRPR
jgi:hypothetical protein